MTYKSQYAVKPKQTNKTDIFLHSQTGKYFIISNIIIVKL